IVPAPAAQTYSVCGSPSSLSPPQYLPPSWHTAPALHASFSPGCTMQPAGQRPRAVGTARTLQRYSVLKSPATALPPQYSRPSLQGLTGASWIGSAACSPTEIMRDAAPVPSAVSARMPAATTSTRTVEGSASSRMIAVETGSFDSPPAAVAVVE